MTTTSWLDQLCGSTFMPHGQCYLWDGKLLSLHAISDSLIALAYFSIPFALFNFVRKRRDLPYPSIFILFGAFIVACGTTHIMEVVTIWHPLYWVSGSIKLATAVISLVSAVALTRIMPQALTLPGPEDLRQLNASLEDKVRTRTADLSAANDELRREVAQRQQAESEVARLNASLQSRLDEMKTLFDILPVGVGIAYDPGCREISTNRVLARMLALPPKANASLSASPIEAPKNFKVFAGGKQLSPEELPMQVAARENKPVLDFEETVEHTNGTSLSLLTNAVPLRDETGASCGCVATFQDITAHKQLEDELRLVIEAIPHALIKTDDRGLITLVNSEAEKLFGYTRAELVGQSVELLVPERIRSPHAGHRASFIADPSARAMGRGRELFGRRKDGSEVPIEIGLNPISTSSGLAVLAAIIDITERKQSERQQADLNRKLLETQKLESLGVLAGGIAHDFNNLLTGILGNASLARMDLSETSPLLPNLDQIEQSAHRAADLCRQMLAYSGKGRFVVQQLDLNQLVDGTTRLLGITISKKCILRFNLAASLPAITADATQIRQIIMNLVINASEAIGLRSGVIAITTGVVRVDQDYLATLLHSEALTTGDYVFLEISDNGAGMDAATLEKIFDPFFTTKFTGRGLGLAAVLGIIRGHKGSLKVYSEPGRGSTFKILLPCLAHSADPSAADAPAAGARWRGQGTVLIVDDEETVRTVSARIIESLGFSVVLAADGREAMEKYRSEPARYALVLLDLTMPHMDGEETFRQMRHLNPAVKVVLMSGFNQQEAISRFTGKGLAGFVQKPFEYDDVVTAIRAVFLQS
jgi:PAS domain S-box-containing protein